MDKPYEFEKPSPNPPHPADPPNAEWIDTGTIYVPIDVQVATAALETGIFLPANYRVSGPALNMILYFHGNKDPKKHHVGQPIRTIWKSSAYPFRDLLQNSGENFILVAPTLGDVGNRSQGVFATRAGAIGFINDVLAALTNYGPYTMTPAVSRLILAAHSGGGYYLKKALPFYEAEYGVEQVWAFDCLYDTTTPVCAPDPYRICEQANGKWPVIPHTHIQDLDLNGWKSTIQGTVEQVLASWGAQSKPLLVYWNRGSGTMIRTANLALLAKLNNQFTTKVIPELYTGIGTDAQPVKPPVATPAHDDIPSLKMPECLAGL